MRNIRNQAILASALAGALIFSAAALAAGAYDGTWTGKDTSGGCAGTVVTITVAENVATPRLAGLVSWYYHGKGIDSDGTVRWINKNGRMTKITFAGKTFDMTASTPCGHLSVTGSRE
jgi:Tfp pilus assembly protein PilV